ncbi:MAG: DUF3261 domain-containing protein [Colwellia sp.]
MSNRVLTRLKPVRTKSERIKQPQAKLKKHTWQKNLLATNKLSFILLCTVFIVSACATQVVNTPRVMLDDNISYVLQPIPDSLMNTGIQALFKVTKQGKEEQFLMQVEMTQSNLLISGMTVEGLSLFSLAWNANLATLTYDKKIAIEPMRVLAELQLVLWPVNDIAHGLENSKIKLTTANIREISSLTGVIYQIKQHENISQLLNLKQDYSIVIEEIDRWQINL